MQITKESEGLQDVPGIHLDHWGVTNCNYPSLKVGIIFFFHVYSEEKFLLITYIRMEHS